MIFFAKSCPPKDNSLILARFCGDNLPIFCRWYGDSWVHINQHGQEGNKIYQEPTEWALYKTPEEVG